MHAFQEMIIGLSEVAYWRESHSHLFEERKPSIFLNRKRAFFHPLLAFVLHVGVGESIGLGEYLRDRVIDGAHLRLGPGRDALVALADLFCETAENGFHRRERGFCGAFLPWMISRVPVCVPFFSNGPCHIPAPLVRSTERCSLRACRHHLDMAGVIDSRVLLYHLFSIGDKVAEVEDCGIQIRLCGHILRRGLVSRSVGEGGGSCWGTIFIS